MTSNEKPIVFCTYKISEDFEEILSESFVVRMSSNTYPTEQEILENVVGAQVIYCECSTRITDEVLNAAGPTLKAVCSHSSGYEHIDLAACKRRNVRIGYLGKLVASCTAEFTLGLMIATARRFKEAMAEITRGEWANRKVQNWLLGFQLIDSTVGIVGLGSIGFELAKRLQAFNVRQILYCGNRSKLEGDNLGLRFTDFDDLLRHSDFVVACCSANEKTRGLFDKNAFELMKSTAVFINISRGQVVDQNALQEALVEQRIFACGLDVTTPEPLPEDHALISMDNCTVLPHLATLTVPLQKHLMYVTVDNIIAGINGQQMACELVI